MRATNGVQAIDLVGRKLGLGGGAVVDGFFDPIAADLAPGGEVSEAVIGALTLLRNATDHLKGADTNAIGAAAVAYLRLFALVSLGWMWARMAAVPGNTLLHQAKRSLALFYVRRILPEIKACAEALKAGSEVLFLLPQDAF